jgi:hypothetical protein
MEIAKNKQWRSLPTEMVHLIAEMTGCVKLRDGFLVPQISKDDPRRQVLATIPKIVLSSRYDGDDEVLVSKVNSTKLTYIGTSWEHSVKFEIYSETKDSTRGYWTLINYYDDGRDIYEDMDLRIELYGLYRDMTFSYELANHPVFLNGYKHQNRIILVSNGNIVDVHEYN